MLLTCMTSCYKSNFFFILLLTVQQVLTAALDIASLTMSDIDQQSGLELDDGVIDKLLNDPTAKVRLLKPLDLDELGQRESERDDDQHRVESNQG